MEKTASPTWRPGPPKASHTKPNFREEMQLRTLSETPNLKTFL